MEVAEPPSLPTSPAVAAPPPAEARKTVTVVFSDVTGSTSLGEQLDPESLRRVMSRYFDEMRSVLERHGGTVEEFIGDAVMAVFGIPTLHEDDALRAVTAASEMRSTLEHLNDELEGEWGVRIRVRTGVNTGEVIAGDASAGQSFASGDAVNVAARLEQNLENVSIPPTINALLTARLDRLDGEERAVIQRGSVVGQVFYWGAVAELSPYDARDGVGAYLQALVRKELIRPDLTDLSGEDAFRFSHILVKDAAYNALPKAIRAELHERFAGGLEQMAGDRRPEYEEIIAITSNRPTATEASWGPGASAIGSPA